MQYSTNYNMNKPELNEQYRLSHWNENTDIIDSNMKRIDDLTSALDTLTSNLKNLTDTTFKTNLFNFMFPKGTVYQNADNSANPSTLFGFGTWVQITDAYLACRGGTHITQYKGGVWDYTLTSANIPQHHHDMAHYHFTNIEHGHNVNDPGHYHGIPVYKNVANNAVSSGLIPIYNAGEEASLRYQMTTVGTGVTVVGTGTLLKSSSWGGYYNAQNNWIDKPNTGSWGSASPTAISLMPTYVGVYTWKRVQPS